MRSLLFLIIFLPGVVVFSQSDSALIKKNTDHTSILNLLYDIEYRDGIDSSMIDEYQKKGIISPDEQRGLLALLGIVADEAADINDKRNKLTEAIARITDDSSPIKLFMIGTNISYIKAGDEQALDQYKDLFSTPNFEKEYAGLVSKYHMQWLQKSDLKDSAIVLQMKALDQFRELDQEMYVAQMLHKVTSRIEYSYHDSTIVYLNEMLDIAKRNDDGRLEAQTLNLLHRATKFKGDYETAIDYIHQSAAKYAGLGDTVRMLDVQLSLVIFNGQTGKNEEADSILNYIRNTSKKMNNHDLLTSTYEVEAMINIWRADTDAVIRAGRIFLKMNEGKNLSSEAVVYFTMANAFYYKAEGDSTYKYVDLYAANETVSKSDVKYYVAQSLKVPFLIEDKKYAEAKRISNEGLKFTTDTEDLVRVAFFYEDLASIAMAEKDYDKAFEYQELKHAKALEEQEFQNVQVTEARKKLEFDNEKKLIALESEKEKQIIKAKQQRAYFFSGIALLGLLFTGLLYVFLKRKNNKIEQQKADLEKLNAVKDQLFQIIGHDLKKPTLAFRGVAKNIDYLISKGDTDRLQKLGKEIDSEANQLYNLTDNLLHWASSQKDVLSDKKTSIDLHDTVRETIQNFETIAKRKSITITSEIAKETIVKANKDALLTIIRNLVDNALKFTNKDGHISIHATQNDGELSLQVKDTGVGMNADRIAQVLSQNAVESTRGTDSEKGSGLGLTIVKKMVDHMDGELTIHSEEGKGSAFEVKWRA